MDLVEKAGWGGLRGVEGGEIALELQCRRQDSKNEHQQQGKTIEHNWYEQGKWNNGLRRVNAEGD